MHLSTKRGKRKAADQEVNDDGDDTHDDEQARIDAEKAMRKAKAAALSAKSKGLSVPMNTSDDQAPTSKSPMRSAPPAGASSVPPPPQTPAKSVEKKSTAGPTTVGAGYTYEPGLNVGAAKPDEKAKPILNPHIILSRVPETTDVANILAAYGLRDWTEGIAPTNPNIALAGAYEYRYMPNCKPRADLYFSVEKPGEDKPVAFKGKKNKRRRGNKREYDADALFVNLRFKCEPKVLQCTLVWPISRVMLTELQAGNWSGVPGNIGRDYMKDKFTDARKKILLTPEWFEVEQFDEKTNKLIGKFAPSKHEIKDPKTGAVIGCMNGDFLAALAADQEMALMMCEMLVMEHPELMVTEKSNKPAYLAAVEADLFGNKIGTFQSNWENGSGPWNDMLQEGKIKPEEHAAKIASLKEKFFIGEDGKVDEAKLRASVPKTDLAKKLMAKCYTNPLKKSKTSGIQFVVFESKITRNASKDEQDKRPIFQNAVEEAIYNASKGKKMYNQHTYTDLNEWSKENHDAPDGHDAKEMKVLSEEERKIQAIKLYDRMIDSGSKIGVVYTLRFFFDAPTGTLGFAREFQEVLFYSPPSKEDLAKIMQWNANKVYKPPTAKITFVPGASRFTTTEITNETEELDIDELVRNVKKSMEEAAAKREENKAKKSKA